MFFAGLAVSNVGTWLQLTAMSLLVYRPIGQGADLGINVALQFLPMLLLGALGRRLCRPHNASHGDRHAIAAGRAGDPPRRCSTWAE